MNENKTDYIYISKEEFEDALDMTIAKLPDEDPFKEIINKDGLQSAFILLVIVAFGFKLKESLFGKE